MPDSHRITSGLFARVNATGEVAEARTPAADTGGTDRGGDSADTTAAPSIATLRHAGTSIAATAPVRAMSVIFVALAWTLVVCVGAQIFIAGLALFVQPGRWSTHTAFVHIFEFLPVIMLVLAVAGRVPLRMRVLCGALFLAIMLQYLLISMRTSDIPELAALHVVNAAGIFHMSVTLARQSFSLARRRLNAEPGLAR